MSNVTGVILPLRQICKKAKEYGAIVIVYGSQSVGLIDISIIADGVDFLILQVIRNLYASLGSAVSLWLIIRLAPVISVEQAQIR